MRISRVEAVSLESVALVLYDRILVFFLNFNFGLSAWYCEPKKVCV